MAARDEVRERLAAAATDLFAERGYAATTVDAIVAAADVSKPALYRHFASKQELHMALLEQHRERLAAAALDGLGEGTADEQIARMIANWFAYVERHPFVLRLLFLDTTGDPEIQEFHRGIQERQRANDLALIETFVPDLPEDERAPTAELIRASLAGLALWWLDHPDVERDVLVATMLRMLRGLASTQA